MKRPILTAITATAFTLPCFSQLVAGKDTTILPIVTTLAGPAPSTIRIYNDHWGKPLNTVSLQWNLQVSGRVIQKGTIPLLTTAPKKSTTIHLPLKSVPDPKDEAFLNVRYILKKKDSLFPAGHIVAATQLLLKPATEIDNLVHPDGELTFGDQDGAFMVSAANTSARFSKQTGFLLQYIVKGDTLLNEPGELKPFLTQEPRLQLFSTSTSTELAIVSADYSLPGNSYFLHMRYTINAKGELQVSQSLEIDTTQPKNTLTSSSPDTAVSTSTSTSAPSSSPSSPSIASSPTTLPVFGMTWTLPARFDSLAWYGAPSPGASTISCSKAAMAPGDFTALRWWKCYSRTGHGILIRSDSTGLDIRVTQKGPLMQWAINYPRYNLPLGNYHYLYKVTPL